jgi:hypothetical protein
MRKRSNKQAFSLFAFQDIITGVTAIILLFTLLLVLELVTRKATQATAAPSASAQQLAELAQEMTDVPSVDFETLKQAPTQEQVLEIIREQKSLLSNSIAKIEEDQKQADEQNQSLDKQLRETQAEFRDEINQSAHVRSTEVANRNQQKVIDSLELQVDRLKEEIELNKQLAELPQGPPVLKFRNSGQGRANSCLVVLERNRIIALPIKEGSKLVWAGTSAVNKFKNWLQANTLSVNHCVVLIRPSGIPLFETVQELIENNGIAIGKETIGENQQVQVIVPGEG